jgi:hypothetical protein
MDQLFQEKFRKHVFDILAALAAEVARRTEVKSVVLAMRTIWVHQCRRIRQIQ